MDRINKILYNNRYQEYIEKIETAEANRCFCRHDIQHFLAVARLAMIYNMKENMKIEKEYIYAASLLHDIGRFKQYECGIPHDEVSVLLAEPILEDAGFNMEERNLILDAIGTHRENCKEQSKSLSDLICMADKKSRNCFLCTAISECKWSCEKKNMYLEW